jgi:hypothetical protein
MKPFRTERLENGVELAFFDKSNRYFGDYHRVCVEVRISVRVLGKASASVSSGRLEQVSHLERMGVAGAKVGATRNRLVEDFLGSAGRYLAHEDYPDRLAATLNSSRRRFHPHGD